MIWFLREAVSILVCGLPQCDYREESCGFKGRIGGTAG